MAVGFGVATCANHPDREALGICVRCKTRVCAECSTKVDGINYCVACLAAIARERDDGRPSLAPAETPEALSLASAALWLAVLAVCAWGIVEAAMPGSR